MFARNHPSQPLVKMAALACFSLLLCVISFSPVQAQDKPPILSDPDISAFSKEEIKRLKLVADNVTNPGAAKLARNKLVAIAVEQIDAAFNDYRKKSRKRHDVLQFIFDFLEIGASSAISLITGAERAREVIAEGLTLFQGSRAAFNKDFRFLERQLLFDKMVSKRSEKLTAIYGKLNNEVNDYPWEQARSELREYFYAGTYDEALNSLSVDTGAEAQKNLADLAVAKREAGIVGAVSEEQKSAHKAFEATIRPIVDKNDAAAARLQKALEDITAAQKKIDDENAKPVANRVQANIDAATATKTAAETERDKAKAEQSKLLEKMKSIFDKIVDNPILTPLLAKISAGKGIQPAQKERIETSLQSAREGKGTFDDYNRVLGNLRRLVVDMINVDPRPNDELQKLLVANQ
jgi:ABC-type transporter MlaC component